MSFRLGDLRRSGARVLAGSTAMFVAGLALTGASAPRAEKAAGTSLSNETFTRSSTAEGWIGLGDACLTAAPAGASAPAGAGTIGGCKKRVDSPTNLGSGSDGFLQLTDNSAWAGGAAVFDRAFPSTAGLRVSFYEYQYAVSATGGSPADGIGFFLTDGAYPLTASGGLGGALGYASSTSPLTPGVSAGYVGVGFDVFGNYSNRSLGGAACPGAATNTRRANSIALRGPGDGMTGYCLLTNKPYASLRNAPAQAPRGKAGTPQLVSVTVSPTTSADPFPTISVDVNGVKVLQQTMTTPPPPTLKMGFAAATGSYHEVHLVKLDSVTTVNPLGAISVVKTVDRAETTGTDATIFTEGDGVPYSYLVTNGGVDPIVDVALSDPKTDELHCPATTLQPQSSMTCTGRYAALKADDVATGTFTDTATATATDSRGTAISGTGTLDVPTYQSAKFAVKREIVGDSPSALPAGQTSTVAYSYPAGSYQPASTGAAADRGGYPAGGGTLTVAPNGTATAPGRIPSGARITLSESAPVDVPGYTWGTSTWSSNPVTIGATGTTVAVRSSPLDIIPAPGMTISNVTKPTAVTAAGQTIAYSFGVSNTGNVPLSDVGVAEAGRARAGRLAAIVCPESTLPVGASETCTVDYEVTQADMDAGKIATTVTAHGTPRGATETLISEPIGVELTVDTAPGLSVSTTADTDLVDTVGQRIAYLFAVHNTGNVTVTGIEVVADGFTGAGTLSAISCPVDRLAPAAAVTCTADYVVTDADLTATELRSTAVATARGAAESGSVTSAPSTYTVPIVIVEVPEEPVELPEEAVEVPEEPVQVPEEAVEVPEEPVEVPEEAVEVPEEPVEVPEEAVEVPEEPVEVPEEAVEVPEEPVEVPEEAVEVPEEAVEVPDAPAVIPDPAADTAAGPLVSTGGVLIDGGLPWWALVAILITAAGAVSSALLLRGRRA